jgi:hypothetical protein
MLTDDLNFISIDFFKHSIYHRLYFYSVNFDFYENYYYWCFNYSSVIQLTFISYFASCYNSICLYFMIYYYLKYHCLRIFDQSLFNYLLGFYSSYLLHLSFFYHFNIYLLNLYRLIYFKFLNFCSCTRHSLSFYRNLVSCLLLLIIIEVYLSLFNYLHSYFNLLNFLSFIIVAYFSFVLKF